MAVAACRIKVWCENVQDREDEKVRAIYPDGMHNTIADGLRELLGEAASVSTATLHEPEHGLTQAVLDETEVLVWWGHFAHEDVEWDVVERVQSRVLNGMGLVVLHSAHLSRIFRTLMGTSCHVNWRDDDEEELVWTVAPGHPIAEGIPHPIVIPEQEMYGEFFDIPAPEELVFVSSFRGGEVFRSGCCFTRGLGRIFYFSPGHEMAPLYFDPVIRRVIANGVTWAAPSTPSGAVRDDSYYGELDWFRPSGVAPPWPPVETRVRPPQ